MIPVGREDIFESALRLLRSYGERTSIRGRFVLVYLGLRKMRDSLASLGDAASTTTGEIEEVLDRLYTKTNRVATLDGSYFTIWSEHFTACPLEHAHQRSRTGQQLPHQYVA